MGEGAVTRLNGACEALILALDHGDAQAVETATSEFASALDQIRAIGGWHATPKLADEVRRALHLADAARARVNYLTDLTRRRFDMLCRNAGVKSTTGYDRFARLR
jgi:hypothetical protein